MFGKKAAPTTFSEDDKKVLLGLIWCLKPSDLSVLQVCLQGSPESRIVTVQGCCNEQFWAWLESKGSSQRVSSEPTQKSPDAPKIALAPDVAFLKEGFAGRSPQGLFFILTPLGRQTLPLAMKLALSGYPPKDATISQEVMKLLLQYAAEKNPEAQNKLGVLHGEGKGVPKSFDEALNWYRLAAESGDKLAHNNIGIMYVAGHGVSKDYNEAMKWFQKGAALGSLGAIDNIGEMYGRGIGVQQNYAEAFKWFHQAAEFGYGAAKSKVGQLYMKGLGIKQDFLQAYIWYSLGMAAGFDTRALRDAAAAQLAQDKIAEANIYITQWKPKEFPKAATQQAVQ
ncbi:MAG: tetratricopeptide repeat protein [Alphaproteobacteria bacterium]